MNTTVVSYSRTGNNRALAESLATALDARHIRVAEDQERRIGTIIADIVFRRNPKIRYEPDEPDPADRLVFVAPVWIGQVATPLRRCFAALRGRLDRCAFVTISGGADGPNETIGEELARRLGREPEAIVDLAIAALLPADPAPTRKDTSAYRVTDADVAALTETVLDRIGAA